jgi:hypothetical protein
MDYKTNTNTKKNEIIKSLEELEVIFNTNIDCSMNPKLCNFSTLLSQTINKTRLYLENDKIITPTEKKNMSNNTSTIPDRNINFEQLSKLNN